MVNSSRMAHSLRSLDVSFTRPCVESTGGEKHERVVKVLSGLAPICRGDAVGVRDSSFADAPFAL